MTQPTFLSAHKAALHQAHLVCMGHLEALRDALNDLAQRSLTPVDLDQPSKSDRRLLDQFAYRYTRLQDDMGARLMPLILKSLGEDIDRWSALDRYARLEQLGWLPDAERWSALRQIRNQFTHDYPEAPEQRLEHLQSAILAASELADLMARIDKKLNAKNVDRV